MISEIKVSVCVVTYNQEKYIAECLQSLVDQKTTFNFDVIVSDDCSTDSTANIIMEYSRNYPDIIKPVIRRGNIGAGRNYIETHALAKGEYIAHMDGDDYALQGKLQSQADYLDSHIGCNLVWHPVLLDKGDGKLKLKGINNNLFYKQYKREDILRFISIGANCSKMYRKTVREFNWPGFDVVDYFANVEQVGEGFSSFSSVEPYGVYRVGVGVSSEGSGTRLILDKSFRYFSEKYPQYRRNINTAVLTYFLKDLINGRDTAVLFFKCYIFTFHPLSIFDFIRNYKIIRSL
ncbi:MAG: glycosyltransferase involved in cell wall biosynthesis [Oceanicoccus sp.]|jgi:glycosyltransferase involved in cell wall biosynthesis